MTEKLMPHLAPAPAIKPIREQLEDLGLSYSFDPPAGDATVVDVKFTYGGRSYERPVNAVFGAKGYDAAATEDQVGAVASGVREKFRLGLIGTPAA